MAALNTLQSNFAIVNAIRTSGGSLNQQALPEMVEWCRRAGYKVCGVGRGCMPTLYTQPRRLTTDTAYRL